MIHAEGALIACVCPECGARCNACMGTNTVVSRENLTRLASLDWIERDLARERQALENGGKDTEDDPCS